MVITKTASMKRLEKWLKKVHLPYSAKSCITNFVLSCDKPSIDDITNFMCIDIINFNSRVQDKLVRGFVFAYYGLKPATYRQENLPDYKMSLN